MSFRLATYLEKFQEECREKFGRTYDFAQLEKHFYEHSTGKQFLTVDDINRIFNPENTPFGRYWPRPDTKVIEELLKEEQILLGPLPNDPRCLITPLLGIFHDIGTVSLFLRFAHPDRFGIFSTPVIHLLQVSRPNTLDLYLTYCEELIRWKEYFRIPTVAQTEMALWTYAQIAKKTDSDPAAAKAVQDFHQNHWAQRQRVAQVIRPFMQRYGRLELAQILLDEDHILAGKIAAEEYERLLDIECRRLRGRPLWRKKSPSIEGQGLIGGLIDELVNENKIRPEDKAELKCVWETRNKAVHPSGERPEREEVEVMIDRISRVCKSWEKDKKGNRT